jgi:protein SCO1
MKSTIIKGVVMILCTIMPVALYLYFKSNNSFAQNNMLPHRWWPINVETFPNPDGTYRYDTTFHQVPSFSYTNCLGQQTTDSAMIGKVSIVEFFFAQCPSICPIMNRNLSSVYHTISKNNNLHLFSFTIDPERDTLVALKKYGEKYEADFDHWHFLRGPQDTTFKLGRSGFKIPVDNTDSETDFLHSDRMILVDWNKNIRGYYLGTDSADMERLKNDVAMLLNALENPKKRKNLREVFGLKK